MPDNRKPLIYGAFPVCRNYTVRAHLRYHGPAERCGCENCVLHAGPLRRWFHPADLHPRYQAKTGRSRCRYGQLHGASSIKTKRKMRRTGSLSPVRHSCVHCFRCLISACGSRCGSEIWCYTAKQFFATKKSPKTAVFRDFWSCYPDLNWGPHPYQGCALPTEL